MERKKKSALEISDEIGIYGPSQIRDPQNLTVHVFIRIADSCRIDTYILSEDDLYFEELWEELRSNGWRFSNTRKFEF